MSPSSMRLRLFTFAVLLAALTGCAPDKQQSYKVVVLAYNDAKGRYEPREVTLTTVSDIVAMQGSAANIVGGTELTFDAPTVTCETLTSGDTDLIRKTAILTNGKPVHVAYFEREGDLVPADFHSLNIATTYYNFEQAQGFFKRVGKLTEKELAPPTVNYFASFTFNGAPLTDNALFFSQFGEFVILPFDQFKALPMAVNLGIIGHEYTHRVFNQRVFGGRPTPVPRDLCIAGSVFPTPALNLLKAVDEGIADFFGTGATCSADLSSCNPSFISLSVPGQAERSLESVACYTDALQKEVAGNDISTFSGGNQYKVGTVLSSALWAAANDAKTVEKLGAGPARQQLYEAVVRALAGDGASKGISGLVAGIDNPLAQDTFRLESSDTSSGVLDVIVGAVQDPLLKNAVCAAFLDRFRLAASALKACPATVKPTTRCQ